MKKGKPISNNSNAARPSKYKIFSAENLLADNEESLSFPTAAEIPTSNTKFNNSLFDGLKGIEIMSG